MDNYEKGHCDYCGVDNIPVAHTGERDLEDGAYLRACVGCRQLFSIFLDKKH